MKAFQKTLFISTVYPHIQKIIMSRPLSLMDSFSLCLQVWLFESYKHFSSVIQQHIVLTRSFLAWPLEFE